MLRHQTPVESLLQHSPVAGVRRIYIGHHENSFKSLEGDKNFGMEDGKTGR